MPATLPPRSETIPAGMRWRAALLLAAANLFWAGNFVLGRAASGEVPPVGLALWRWALALALLLPFTAAPLWRARGLLMRHWVLFSVLALFGVGSFNTLTYLALARTEAVNAALTNSLVPVAILVSAFLLDRERPRPMQIAGLCLSLVGVAAIVARGDTTALLNFRINPGDAIMLVAVVAWGLYTVLLRRVPASVHQALGPIGLLAATVLFGVPLIALCRGLELALGGVPMPRDGATLALVAYTAIAASIVAYLCWNRGVAMIGASASGPFLHLLPLFAAGLAVPLLGEVVRPYHALGLVLIIAGVALAGRR